MEAKICSENYRLFFDGINRTGISVAEVAALVKEKVPVIAGDIHLGKLICRFSVPPSPMDIKGTDVEYEMYIAPEGAGEEGKTFSFNTGDGGSVSFFACPVKDYTWNEEELEEIRFVCDNIYVICGRSRVTDIIGKALTRDMGTGLLNANGFLAAGNRLIKADKIHEYCAMYLNLKNFGFVNGRIGNKHGDEVIKAYAAALVGFMEKDEFAARLGGDNFTLLVKKERSSDVLRFLSNVEVEVMLGGMPTPFSLSARVGVYNVERGDVMEHVMNCISAAIGSVKRRNTGDVAVFDFEIMRRIERDRTIESDFPKALANREFIVYYQPKVDLKTSVLCGCEALVRWNKDGKIVPPGDFIPLFERNGNVCALDFYMLESVCADLRRWLDNGLEPVTVSVNFSKTHLHNPRIAEEILAVIKKYNIDSRYIEIELTEMSDYSDYAAFKALVTKMKENGVLTSIDDFGTGYSSLNLLTDFMFDVVKLDKSFLDNIVKNNSKTDEIVVRNMVRMIKELDMMDIAEGVETSEQAKFLKDIECTMVQGYLFDKPLPVGEFEKRLEAKKYSLEI